jgi:hypothetical protein
MRDALKPIHGSVGEVGSRIAVPDASGRDRSNGDALSEVAWIKSARRGRVIPAMLRALSMPIGNPARATKAERPSP